MGSPGAIDPEAGTVARAGNLSDWGAPFPVGAYLSDRLDVPVSLGNDVDVATQAEFAMGAGREAHSLLGVFWGTGVGGGLVLDDQPWRGRGAAGEIGHVVVKMGGARCPCGRRGCMEAYAGRRAMESKARRKARRAQDEAVLDHGEARTTGADQRCVGEASSATTSSRTISSSGRSWRSVPASHRWSTCSTSSWW